MLPFFFFLVSSFMTVEVLSELRLITTIWDAALQSCTKVTLITKALQPWVPMDLEMMFEQKHAAAPVIASGLSASYVLLAVLGVQMLHNFFLPLGGKATIWSFTPNTFNLANGSLNEPETRCNTKNSYRKYGTFSLHLLCVEDSHECDAFSQHVTSIVR